MEIKFSDQIVQAVWEKGQVTQENNPNIWRKDICTAWMKRQDYGDRQSKYGWEIDHIIPKSNGGSDHISNLRPLQWENNAERSNGKLTCPIRS